MQVENTFLGRIRLRGPALVRVRYQNLIISDCESPQIVNSEEGAQVRERRLRALILIDTV